MSTQEWEKRHKASRRRFTLVGLKRLRLHKTKFEHTLGTKEHNCFALIDINCSGKYFVKDGRFCLSGKLKMF